MLAAAQGFRTAYEPGEDRQETITQSLGHGTVRVARGPAIAVVTGHVPVPFKWVDLRGHPGEVGRGRRKLPGATRVCVATNDESAEHQTRSERELHSIATVGARRTGDYSPMALLEGGLIGSAPTT